jgi:hypothetical protein
VTLFKAHELPLVVSLAIAVTFAARMARSMCTIRFAKVSGSVELGRCNAGYLTLGSW